MVLRSAVRGVAARADRRQVQDRQRHRAHSADPRVTVGRHRQTQPCAQRFAVLVAGAESPGLLQQRHHFVDDRREIGGVDGRPQPRAVDTEPLPVEQHVDQFLWAATEVERIRARIALAVERNQHVGIDFQFTATGRADLIEDASQRCIVLGRDEHDIGAGGCEFIHRAGVCQCRDHRLALRRTRRDRRALDREVLSEEVDVVQFVGVHIAPGGHIANDRVVLPAVPETAHHVDVLNGLVEIGNLGFASPAEQGRLVRGCTNARLPARPAVRHIVKGGDGFGDVEGLGVGDRRHRNQADVARRRSNARRDQHGIPTTGEPSRVDPFATPRLRHQAVVDGEEVEQSAFGGGRQIGPVASAEHRRGAGLRPERGPPGLRVPSVSVQRDGQVQRLAGQVSSLSNAIGKTGPSDGSGPGNRVYPPASYSFSASGWRSPVIR